MKSKIRFVPASHKDINHSSFHGYLHISYPELVDKLGMPNDRTKEGAYNGAVNWLSNATRPNRSSANFVIGRNQGEIVQLVKITDVAWHAGIISNPNDRAKRIMKKNLDGSWVNPNQYTIGIELAAGYDVDQDGAVEPNENDVTEWQYQALVELVKSFTNNPDTSFVLDEKISSFMVTLQTTKKSRRSCGRNFLRD